MKCDRCGNKISEEESYVHNAQSLCEDCYMDILSPTKACDPWAVYSAKMTLKGKDVLGQLTPVQQKIVEFLTQRSEASAEEIAESVGIPQEELGRQFATLRHMEIVKATKKGEMVLFKLFDQPT